MAKKETTPQSLYESGREFLREQIRTNELLADIAGVEYTPPEGVPKGKYMENKWLLDAAEKKNELLGEIAETGGVAGGANKLAIDYETDILSLKKGGNPIPDSGVTLPAYGINFDPTTGGLTLTKNGTAMSGQTVTIPNYGSPVAVEDSANMTDHDVIYLYEGTTGATYTNGHFYYWDGAAWADGGEYAAATVQTDKTLLVEDAAADAKATGDAVAELKTQLDHTIDVVVSKNLYNPNEKTDGYYLNATTGELTENSGRSVSDFIEVIPGKYLTFSNEIYSGRAAYSMPSFCFYNSGKEPISGGSTWKSNIVVPDGATYARVCFETPVSKLQVELTDDGIFTDYESYFAPIYKIDLDITIPQEQVDGLEEALSFVSNVAEDVDTLKTQMSDIAISNDYDEPYFEVYLTPYYEGYMGTNGVVQQSTTFFHTDKIPVKPGYILTGTTTDHSNSVQFRFVCAFSGDTAVPSAGNGDDVSTYTVPDGIDYVVVSQRNVSAGKTRSVEIKGVDAANKTNIKQNPLGYMKATGNMSDGDELHVSENNVKNNVCVAFTANITTFDNILIGQRKGNTWRSSYIEIDNTNITIHTDQGDSVAAHGLTIGSDIQIFIETENEAETSLIRIYSNGEEYEDTNPHRWLCDQGYSAVVSDGCVLTDCVLSWTSRNINAPIWIFGDSYISLYDVRWVYYLLRDGFDKSVLLNGYAGEQSADAMTALNNLIETRKPQYIFWILGMNNADSETAVNTSWKENFDLVVNLCKKWNITPIFGTIPSVPTINNEFKNSIIRESGYRFVDFSKAVDPSGTGTWIGNTLSNDGVHPSVTGAKVLYMQALSDFPELTTY